MEKDDKGSTLIRIGVSGESSFWYRPTRVVPDQRPLNGRCSNKKKATPQLKGKFQAVIQQRAARPCQ